MAKGEYLGEFEQLVLLAALRLGKNAYGVTIWEEIEKRTGRPVMLGAVYATLDRLETKRYISSKSAKMRQSRTMLALESVLRETLLRIPMW